MNLLGCEGVPEAFSFDIIVKLWSSRFLKTVFFFFFPHLYYAMPRDAIHPKEAVSQDLGAVVCLAPTADVTLDTGTEYKEQSHFCTSY